MNRTLLDTDILSDFLRGQNINVLCRAQAWLQNAEVLAFDDKSARLGGEIAGAFCGLEPRLVLLTF